MYEQSARPAYAKVDGFSKKSTVLTLTLTLTLLLPKQQTSTYNKKGAGQSSLLLIVMAGAPYILYI